MTSGRKTRTRPEARAVALALALGVAAAPAHAFDLAELMGLLAHRASGQAHFVEQRWVKGFDEPLVASGTLEFSAPDRFVRRTLAPRAETLEVEGNRLVMSRSGRSRTVALDTLPEAAAAVAALRGTLTGDAAALRRDFDATVGGSAAHWTLALAPHDPATVAAVRIEGRGELVQNVETRLPGGDRSVMTITPAAEIAASAPTP